MKILPFINVYKHQSVSKVLDKANKMGLGTIFNTGNVGSVKENLKNVDVSTITYLYYVSGERFAELPDMPAEFDSIKWTAYSDYNEPDPMFPVDTFAYDIGLSTVDIDKVYLKHGLYSYGSAESYLKMVEENKDR